MDTLNVSSKAWHYRFATKYASLSTYDIRFSRVDSCTYIRRVMLGLVLFFCLSIATVIVLIPLTHLIMWLVVCAVNLSFVPLMNSEVTFLGALEVFFGCLGGLVYFGTKGITWILDHLLLKDETVEPSFIVQAYRSWKNKYCIKVKEVE